MSNPPTMAITGTSSRSRTLLTHLACAELRRSRIHVISLPAGLPADAPAGLLADRSSEIGEIGDEPIDIRVIMLHGDQPLLGLAPRRQEYPAVVLQQPVRVTVGVVDVQEAAEIADRLGGEDHAALGPDRDNMRLQPVAADLPLQASDRPLAQPL